MIRWWLVQVKSASGWSTEVLPKEMTVRDLPANTEAIAVRAVDRTGNLGPVAVTPL